MKKNVILLSVACCLLVASNAFVAYKYVNVKEAYQKAEGEKVEMCHKLCDEMCKNMQLQEIVEQRK